MTYILTRKSLLPSARALASELAKKLDIKIEVDTEPRENVPLIRWGNSSRQYATDTLYNSRNAIKRAANRIAFSNICGMKGITHVDLQQGVPTHFPILVRTVLNGMGGKGIVICSDLEEFEPYKIHHWTVFHNFSYELGVHMLGGEIVKVFKKKWEGSRPEPKFPIRNAGRGYHFERRSNINAYTKLHPYISRIYNEFEVEMGRLDVGWDSENRTYRAIEMNTAPGLTENQDTLNMYVDFLANRINL